MDERDIHEREKRIEAVLSRIEDSEEIISENAEALKDFNTHLKTVRSVKTDRRHFYLNRVSKIAKWVDKPFSEFERDDVKEIQGRIEEEDYSEWTKHDYLTALKKFFQWLHRDKLDNYAWKSDQYPDLVKNIDTSVGKDANKLPTNLPTKEDIKEMIEVCRNSRDKAILMTLFDGGFRVGEFLNIQVGDLEEKPRGISVIVHGKTGSRQVLLPLAEPYLSKWLDDHPDADDDAYLWVNVGNRNFGEPMKYDALRRKLKRLKDRAELSCKVNPHAFRKASATFYAHHLNEVQMCDRYGWVYGSDMPGIYIKQSGERTNNAVLSAVGIKEKEETKEKELKPKVCPRCETKNEFDSERCKKCGKLLDGSKVQEETITESDLEEKMMGLLEKDPDKWAEVFMEVVEKSENK